LDRRKTMGKGKQVAYIRVSTLDQNTGRQLDGQAFDKTFTDKASGKDASRPQLQAALEYLREGDTLHVHSMDRLARNVDDLRAIVKGLTSRSVVVRFHKEGLTFTGEDSPMSSLLLSMLGAVAEFERSLIRERQREGIAIAKTKGVYKGRKKALTEAQVEVLKGKAKEPGQSKTELAKEYGISRETLYQYIR
jgi:DNA invertase Pin-like site-specific DNA recombinase